MSDQQQFNVRAYGVVINSQKRVLILQEKIAGKVVFKFPGGGLEWGEGLENCLEREFREELDCQIKIISPFFITPHFQQSFFRSSDQIISLYYSISLLSPLNPQEDIKTHWMSPDELKITDFFFPIDKLVVKKILSEGFLSA